MSRLWEILSKFKLFCKCRGLKTSESEDWVEVDDNYHNFLWAREVHPSSFARIASDKKCVIQHGMSYRVVEAAYTAWLFSDSPSASIVRTICENPDFSKRIALYDLSQMAEGKNLCVKLNNTDSHVFEEFENFLRNELRVKVEPLAPLLGRKASPNSCKPTVMA